MGADMIDCNQLQSNLSLPFGKVRMGYHTGEGQILLVRLKQQEDK